jgi:putative transport protein
VAATAFCVVGGLITALIRVGFRQPMEAAVGMSSGAATNTPSLAAGMQMLANLGATSAQVATPPIADAVAYPFGILLKLVGKPGEREQRSGFAYGVFVND